MRNRFLAAFSPFLAIVLVTAPASAERTLTLDEVLRLARENNRDLQAARARLGGAEAGIEQARAALMPTVNAQGKYSHNIPEVAFQPPTVQTPMGPVTPEEVVLTPANQLDASLTAIVPLVVPSAYAAYSAAQKTQTAAEAELRVTATRLLFTTAQVFYAAAGTDELVVARRHAVEVAEQTLINAQTRFETGTATKVETTRAQLSVVRAQQAEREAQEQQANVYAQLATLIRAPAGFRVVPPPIESDRAAPAAAESLVATAAGNRPELAAYQMRLEALGANIDALRWRWAPTVAAFGNARAFNYSGFAGRNTAYAFGVQLDWQIFDAGMRDAQRHSLEAQLLDTRLQLEQVRSSVADDVRQARRAIGTKRSALEAAQLAVALSEETLGLVRAQYEAGTALQIDLLAAQDNLIGAEVGLAQARFDVALADLTLQRNAGTFLSEHTGGQP